MKNDDQKIRLNIIIDPQVFPEIHAEMLAMQKNKKRINGSRFLYLATMGLAMTKNGFMPSGERDTPAMAKVEVAQQNSEPADVKVRPANAPAPIVETLDHDEAEDLAQVMSGEFSFG